MNPFDSAQGRSLGDYPSPFTLHCLLSIPNGELLAQKTLNARLGIIGGLSILGTTGIVRPISAQAWTDTIDAAIDVALACGCGTVVLSTGRSSELVAQKFLSHNAPPPLTGGGRGVGEGGNSVTARSLPLSLTLPRQGGGNEGVRQDGAGRELFSFPEEAFIMMGDHVGYALRSCAGKGVKRMVLAGQFAKLLKIACGHEQTHVSASDLDLAALSAWPELESHNLNLDGATTARGILESSGNDPELIHLVCRRATSFAHSLAPGPELKVLLAGYGGEVLYFA